MKGRAANAWNLEVEKERNAQKGKDRSVIQLPEPGCTIPYLQDYLTSPSSYQTEYHGGNYEERGEGEGVIRINKKLIIYRERPIIRQVL